MIYLFSHAQIDTTELDYYPLEVGNCWQYKIYECQSNWGGTFENTSYHYYEVIGEEIFNSKRYHVITITSDFSGYNFLYFRTDTNTGIVYQNINGEDKIKYKLYTQVGDTHYFDILDHICSSIDSITYLGMRTIKKTFSYNSYTSDLSTNSEYIFTLGLGLIKHYWFQRAREFGYNSKLQELLYAKIRGIEYGELVEIEDIVLNQDQDFMLLQNYPNPFNNITIFKYVVPKKSLIRLAIIDI